MNNSRIPVLVLTLGCGLGGVVGFLLGRRGVEAAWFEVIALLLLGLGWLGTAVAFRRHLEALLTERLAGPASSGPVALAASPPVPPAAVCLAKGALVAAEVGAPPAELDSDGGELQQSSARAQEAEWRPEEAPPGEGPLPTANLDVLPMAEALLAVWQAYLERGDGRFTPGGLQRFLDDACLAARVVALAGTLSGPDVLAVEDSATRDVYLLPNFNSTVRAVEEWFQASHPTSLTARIQRLLHPARLRYDERGLVLVEPGTVE